MACSYAVVLVLVLLKLHIRVVDLAFADTFNAATCSNSASDKCFKHPESCDQTTEYCASMLKYKVVGDKVEFLIASTIKLTSNHYVGVALSTSGEKLNSPSISCMNSDANQLYYSTQDQFLTANQHLATSELSFTLNDAGKENTGSYQTFWCNFTYPVKSVTLTGWDAGGTPDLNAKHTVFMYAAKGGMSVTPNSPTAGDIKTFGPMSFSDLASAFSSFKSGTSAESGNQSDSSAGSQNAQSSEGSKSGARRLETWAYGDVPVKQFSIVSCLFVLALLT